MPNFAGVKKQTNGKFRAFFYTDKDEYHSVSRNEECERSAAWALMQAIEAFTEQHPDTETYYEPRYRRNNNDKIEDDLWIEEIS